MYPTTRNNCANKCSICSAVSNIAYDQEFVALFQVSLFVECFGTPQFKNHLISVGICLTQNSNSECVLFFLTYKNF